MADTISRQEFDAIARQFQHEGAKFGWHWVIGRADPVMMFHTVTAEQQAALERDALRVRLPVDDGDGT